VDRWSRGVATAFDQSHAQTADNASSTLDKKDIGLFYRYLHFLRQLKTARLKDKMSSRGLQVRQLFRCQNVCHYRRPYNYGTHVRLTDCRDKMKRQKTTAQCLLFCAAISDFWRMSTVNHHHHHHTPYEHFVDKHCLERRENETFNKRCSNVLLSFRHPITSSQNCPHDYFLTRNTTKS
jgi:hypothetical protein